MVRQNFVVNFSVALFFVFSAAAFQHAHPNNDDPIAYIGHGAMFDKDGKEIQVTQEFIKEVYRFYLEALFKQANEQQRALVEQKQKRLFSGRQFNTQSELYVNSALIEWLIKEIRPVSSDTLSGKLKLLKQKWTSPSIETDPSVNIKEFKPFELPGALRDLLLEEGLVESGGSGTALRSTTLGGAAYTQECNKAGVPTPPDWGTGQ
jgi:hypothetical protein